MADFSFLVVNDLHYVGEQCQPFFGRMVEQMRSSGAAFVAVLGDLGEEGTADELRAMRTLLDGTGLPLRVVCGNHDWTTDTGRSAYHASFPGPTNYVFEHEQWQFVALDSTAGRAWDGTAVPDSSLRWLDEALPTLDRHRPTVLLTHFPLGEGIRYRVTNAVDVLGRFRGLNLRHVFNGHFHGLTEVPCDGYTITTNPCCSFARRNHDRTDAKGFVLARTEGQAIHRTFVEIR
jgi:3',5'-cyclic AMP phosphodiesterase CpdA